MRRENIPGVPGFEEIALHEKQSDYCLLIPVINEGERIRAELERAQQFGIDKLCDIIICDGGSSDGSLDISFLAAVGVNALLEKTGPGKQGAQLRMGLYFAKERGYEGVLTIDGNNKDSIESVPLFINALTEGYDFIQGSRFIEGGEAINTPLVRHVALRLIHAPLTSLAAKHRFTDTTNAFRAYSKRYLEDSRTAPLRDEFAGYELLAYLAIRATQLGYSAIEVPVMRAYPASGSTPTKIKGLSANMDLLKVLLRAVRGYYNPQQKPGDR